MTEEVISYLVNEQDKYFLDCTVGEGGHSEEILTRFPGIVVYGLDRDEKILKIARNRLSIFHERFHGIKINFKDILLSKIKLGGAIFDSALIDLGISLFHYKKSNKGFSFFQRERLDMRLDDQGLSVYDIINTYSEECLADIFIKFGEERFARRIANKIVDMSVISRKASHTLEAKLSGDHSRKYDDYMQTEIKAVTFHGLSVKKVKNEYWARVIFDI